MEIEGNLSFMAGWKKADPAMQTAFQAVKSAMLLAVAWHGRQNLSLSHDRRWHDYIIIVRPFLSTTKNRKGLFL